MKPPGQDHQTLAVTKLRAPTVSDLVVERPRLTDLLDAAVESSAALGLVSAPAGAGKSTALATWLAARPDLRSAWVHIDERDNDPIRFWSGIVIALAGAHPGLDDRLLPVLRAPSVPFIDGPLPVLVNALDGEAGHPLAVVLDDYHLITNSDVHDGVQALIDALPGHVTPVISCRFEPPLRLGRLRVRGQLVEIRATDLAFDRAEAAIFFPSGVLDRDQVDRLQTRTEGWAAGLALAAVSLARSSDPVSFVANFAGDNRLVVDYLATEFWDGLPGTARERMLATSVLEQMCGPLVDAVAVTDDGTTWLEDLARENQLLVSLDEHRHWYRYHHLLRDLLRQELHRTDPDRAVALHRRATEWFVANDHNEDAIGHALAAGDVSTAAQLLGAEGHKMIHAGHLATLQDWLNRLGPEVVDEHLECVVLQVWNLVITGLFDQVGPWLETAQGLVVGEEDTEQAELVAAAATLTALANGNIAAALAGAERLTDDAGIQDLTPLASDIAGGCHLWAGHFGQARPLLERSIRTAPGMGQHLSACTSRRDLAVLALEEGDHGEAHQRARDTLAYAEANHLTAYHQIALAHSVLGVTLLADDRSEASRQVELGVALARRSNRPIMLAYALASQAQLEIDDQRAGAARTSLTEARHLLDRCPDPGMALTTVARQEARLGGGISASPPTRGPLVDALTPRELTVLRLLPSRLNVGELADELYVSPNTVKGHVKAIYRKLGVNERGMAVQRARELRLL